MAEKLYYQVFLYYVRCEFGRGGIFVMWDVNIFYNINLNF